MSHKAFLVVIVAHSFHVLHNMHVLEAEPIADSPDSGGHSPPHSNHLRKAQKQVAPTKPPYQGTGPPLTAPSKALFYFYVVILPW